MHVFSGLPLNFEGLDIANIGGLDIDSMLTDWTNAGNTIADLGIVSAVDINGGSIDNTAIGENVPNIGKFGASSNHTNISSNGDVSFVGAAGFYPRRVDQAGEPASGTGPTQIDEGELMVWRENGSDNWLIYNDPTNGILTARID